MIVHFLGFAGDEVEVENIIWKKKGKYSVIMLTGNYFLISKITSLLIVIMNRCSHCTSRCTTWGNCRCRRWLRMVSIILYSESFSFTRYLFTSKGFMAMWRRDSWYEGKKNQTRKLNINRQYQYHQWSRSE